MILRFFLYRRISYCSCWWVSRASFNAAMVFLSVNSPYIKLNRQDFCITCKKLQLGLYGTRVNAVINDTAILYFMMFEIVINHTVQEIIFLLVIICCSTTATFLSELDTIGKNLQVCLVIIMNLILPQLDWILMSCKKLRYSKRWDSQQFEHWPEESCYRLKIIEIEELIIL